MLAGRSCLPALQIEFSSISFTRFFRVLTRIRVRVSFLLWVSCPFFFCFLISRSTARSAGCVEITWKLNQPTGQLETSLSNIRRYKWGLYLYIFMLLCSHGEVHSWAVLINKKMRFWPVCDICTNSRQFRYRVCSNRDPPTPAWNRPSGI